MNYLIGDPLVVDKLLEARRANGGDRFDEVWGEGENGF